MNKKAMILAMAVLTGGMWGCGSDSSSSSESTSSGAAVTETASADTTEAEETEASLSQPGGKAEDLNYYDTQDGMFRVGFSRDYAEYSGETLTDCEYSLSPDGLSVVGVMSVCGKHFTAKGFTEGMVEDFNAAFDNVSWEETEINGLPAVSLTASQSIGGETYTFQYYMVQYGNGDLFVLAAGTPFISSYQIDMDEILSTVEYKGEPLKTGDEVWEGDHFSLTAGEIFCVTEKSSSAVDIKYNLCNGMDEYMTRMAVAEEEGTSAKKAFTSIAKSRYENQKTVSLKEDETEFLGHDAYYMEWKLTALDYDLETRAWYFEVNGKVYSVTCISVSDNIDRFVSECQPVIDSLEFV